MWSILPSESVVTALAWRPDGKGQSSKNSRSRLSGKKARLIISDCAFTHAVLSVGRSDGSVCLYSVEDGQPLHEFSARAPISSLQWALQSEER